MISKDKTDYQEISGGGRPFDMRGYKPEPKTDAERNTPQIIDLQDLNQDGKAPVNFSREAGRIVSTFTEYWVLAKDSKDIK